MVNIFELYPRVNDTINSNDLQELKMPLTISSLEISGESKKTVKFSFKETPLKFKCSKMNILKLAELYETNETDEFIDKKITLIAEDGKVKIEV